MKCYIYWKGKGIKKRTYLYFDKDKDIFHEIILMTWSKIFKYWQKNFFKMIFSRKKKKKKWVARIKLLLHYLYLLLQISLKKNIYITSSSYTQFYSKKRSSRIQCIITLTKTFNCQINAFHIYLSMKTNFFTNNLFIYVYTYS